MAQDEVRCVNSLAAPLGRFELSDVCWPGKFQTTACDSDPVLSMTLLKPNVARLGRARARYESGSARTEYRPLGAVVLLPADIAMHADSSAGEAVSGRILMATFNRRSFESVTGITHWDPATLEHCVNVPSPRLASLMREMARELAASQFAAETAVAGLAHLILAELARTFAQRRSILTSGLTPWQLRVIEQHLKKAQGHWPTCAELAQLCGISAGHLSRTFRITTGCTLSDYAAEIRMERAKALLGACELSLQQIAGALGFNSPSSFSFAFRQHVGATPKAFRQKARCDGAFVTPVAA